MSNFPSILINRKILRKISRVLYAAVVSGSENTLEKKGSIRSVEFKNQIKLGKKGFFHINSHQTQTETQIEKREKITDECLLWLLEKIKDRKK